MSGFRNTRPMFVLLLSMTVSACADRDGAGPAVADSERVTDTGSPPELARAVERMMPALERLSGLDRTETMRVRRQSREGARAYVEQRLDEELSPEERDAVRRTYVALGLLPDTLDLDALLLDLYTEQVLGYYDPTDRTLFVVSGESVRSLEQVIAHELVHALQDQHTDLDSLIAGERGNDRQTAAHAAMEGHAMLVMFAFLAEQQTNSAVDPAALPDPAAELRPALEEQNSQFPVFRRTPAIIRETLLFPYVSGVSFVHTLWRSRAPLERYPAPLDSLLPQSTEQVMHPVDHFIRARDEPADVTLPAMPDGWRVVHQDQLGQLETGIFLAEHLGEAARPAAQGWAGDACALLAAPGGHDVLYWVSVWDTAAAADRFAAAAVRAAATREGRQVSVRRGEQNGRAAVQIVDAPIGADTDALLPAG